MSDEAPASDAPKQEAKPIGEGGPPTAANPPGAGDAASVPDYSAVRSYLSYSLSLPERAIRSASGLVGGALHHSAELLVPQAFQDSKTYSVLVRQMLDFMVADIGRVERPASAVPQEPKVDDFVARKTVGNFIDMAGLATLHVSPLLVLALVSDIAYGSQTYLRELGVELKQQGIIDENSSIERAGDLLDAVSRASGVTAAAFDTPPLSVDGLRDTIRQTREAVSGIDPASVLPQAELDRMWAEMHAIADRDGVGMLEVSSAMTLHTLAKIGTLGKGALSSVRVAGSILDRCVLDHYRTALCDIRARGLYATLAETSQPYIEAVWRNFSTDKPTITEDLLSGKLIGQATGAVRRWLGLRGESPRGPAKP
jgi:hypothetical protein